MNKSVVVVLFQGEVEKKLILLTLQDDQPRVNQEYELYLTNPITYGQCRHSQYVSILLVVT